MVVDAHDLFRYGLVTVLEQRRFEIVGTAASAADALDLIRHCSPDVALIDLNLPDLPGVELIRRLATAHPPIPVLVLTVVSHGDQVVEALREGACGYLLKDASVDEIATGIWAVARGETPLSPRVAARLVAQLRESPDSQSVRAPDLTDRQLEILDLLTKGVSNQKIASALYLSEHTVKTHVSSILMKLQAENRIQAAVRAVRYRLV